MILGTWPLVLITLVMLSGFLLTAVAARYQQRDEDADPFQLKRALLRGVPPSLILMFGVVPSISVKLFSAFNCIGYDDDDGTKIHQFMLDNPSVSCDDNEEYDHLLRLARIFIFVWPIGATAICSLLLLKARGAIVDQKSTQLSRCISFLHEEYMPDLCFWEILMLAERITLSGALVLIPHNLQFFRLFCALLVSLCCGVATLLSMPYKKVMHNYLSITTHVGLWGILLGSLCLKLLNDIKETEGIENIDVATYVLGVSNINFYVNFMLSFVIVTLVVVFISMGQQAAFDQKLRIIRLTNNGSPPELTLPRRFTYHLYLSHYWATAHYPAAHIQKEISALLLGCRAFHPDLVDDAMEHTRELEDYISQALCVLIFLSNGYWSSALCLREIRVAIKQEKSLIRVVEPNVGRGGQPIELSRHECPPELRAAVFGSQGESKSPTGSFKSKAPATCDVASGIFSKMTSSFVSRQQPNEAPAGMLGKMSTFLATQPNELQAELNKRPPVPIVGWHFLPDFQLESLRLIAMQVLAQTPTYVGKDLEDDLDVFISGELRTQQLEFDPHMAILVSKFNSGADEAAAELIQAVDRVRGLHYDPPKEKANCSSGNARVSVARKWAERTMAAATKQQRTSTTTTAPVQGGMLSDASNSPRGRMAARLSTVRARVGNAVAEGKGARQCLKQQSPVVSLKRDSLAGAVDIVGGFRKRSIYAQGKTQLTGLKPGEKATMLVYLNSKTWSCPTSQFFAAHVQRALDDGLEIAVVHELDGARGGTEFATILHQTPRALQERGLFQKRAQAWPDGATHRLIGVKLLAKSIGAKRVGMSIKSMVRRGSWEAVLSGSLRSSKRYDSSRRCESGRQAEKLSPLQETEAKESCASSTSSGMRGTSVASELRETAASTGQRSTFVLYRGDSCSTQTDEHDAPPQKPSQEDDNRKYAVEGGNGGVIPTPIKLDDSMSIAFGKAPLERQTHSPAITQGMPAGQTLPRSPQQPQNVSEPATSTPPASSTLYRVARGGSTSDAIRRRVDSPPEAGNSHSSGLFDRNTGVRSDELVQHSMLDIVGASGDRHERYGREHNTPPPARLEDARNAAAKALPLVLNRLGLQRSASRGSMDDVGQTTSQITMQGLAASAKALMDHVPSPAGALKGVVKQVQAEFAASPAPATSGPSQPTTPTRPPLQLNLSPSGARGALQGILGALLPAKDSPRLQMASGAPTSPDALRRARMVDMVSSTDSPPQTNRSPPQGLQRPIPIRPSMSSPANSPVKTHDDFEEPAISYMPNVPRVSTPGVRLPGRFELRT
mmetsp:Transcript_65730/g.196421  ORF Transcript_65730/g.196421 Transcript_65730/m.196421 type:complete len:1295 (-) Transcript_65730:205-4089(-)